MTENEMLLMIYNDMKDIKTHVANIEVQMNDTNARVINLEAQMKDTNARVINLEAQMTRLEDRVINLEERVTALEAHMTRLEDRVINLEEHVAALEKQTQGIRLTLENETNRNIKLVAEGHLDLSRKLDNALKVENEKEMLLIRVNILENEVRKLKEQIELIA